jgi:hypothetical protein
VSSNALAAYSKAATGRGVTIGVIDSGIDLQSAEFEGRLSSASRDVAGNASLDDEGGHGTAVAFTAAGRRDGRNAHGIAFEAGVASFRADAPGSCASTDGCKFWTDAIARGIDGARLAGAKVVNISLGGGSATGDVRQAVDRATAAGMIIVFSAGNDAAADPDGFAAIADEAVSRGQVIIAGSVSSSGSISGFSNRAGAHGTHYLAAVGERVVAPDQNATLKLWSGTSFSAPTISGAVALLAQAFPNLSGRQIVDLLLETARDAGETGTDAVYGRGVLDLTRAFQPVGSLSVAGLSSVPVSTTDNGVLSPAMGDATGGAGVQTLATDAYMRAFAIDLTPTLGRTGVRGPLGDGLSRPHGTTGFAMGTTSVTVALTADPGRRPESNLASTTLTSGQAASARAVAATVAGRLGARTSFAFGASQDSRLLEARLAGASSPAFLVARDDVGVQGAVSEGSMALRRSYGSVGLTVSSEAGRMPRLAASGRDSTWNRTAVVADRRFGPVSLRVGGSRMAESETLLGARLGDAFGAPAGTTWSLDGSARADLGRWTVGASMRQGVTTARLNGAVTGSGSLRTGAWSFDFGRLGVFGPSDSLGLRLSQPLRVSSGGLDLEMPVGWDYATGAVSETMRQPLSLAPRGREIDAEIRYGIVVPAGVFDANLFARSQPNNLSDAATDWGAAVRASLRF